MKYINIDLNSKDELKSNNNQPDLDSISEKMVLSTTDVNYISYLIEKGNLKEAKQILNNLKSTISIMYDLINQTEDYLLLKEGKLK